MKTLVIFMMLLAIMLDFTNSQDMLTELPLGDEKQLVEERKGNVDKHVTIVSFRNNTDLL